MYQALDKFMNIETWHSRHPLDEARFFKALHNIVHDPDFNADEMAEYMREKVGIDRNDEQHPYAQAIEHYQAAGWAVRQYLDATRN